MASSAVRFGRATSKAVAPMATESQPSRGSVSLMSEHKSQRYRTVRTHRSVQKDMIREYRKNRKFHRCRQFCDSRSSTGFWIDSSQAQAMAHVAIVVNTLVLLFQAYTNDGGMLGDELSRTAHTAYMIVELCFLLLFSAELALRCHATLNPPFMEPWNRYDAFLILFCAVDTCVLAFLQSAEDAHRVAVHLMPVLQVMRLGRFVPELRLIINGILSAMHAVLWSMCLLALVIYFFAVLGSNYVGNSLQFSEDSIATELFGNLPDAMFTLFTFATLEDFPGAVRHFMHCGFGGGLVALAIIGFILFTNLALLNLVTAVMVDSIIDILPKKHSESLARERGETVRRLEALFLKMDEDGDRKLSLEEFKTGVEAVKEVQSELNLLQISTFDVKELFALIDFNDYGRISVDEFIEGLLRMVPGPASKKELLGVQYDMHKMWNMLGAGQERLMASTELAFQELPLADIECSIKGHLQERLCELERSVRECHKHGEEFLEGRLSALSDQLRDGQQRLAGAVAAMPAALEEKQRRLLEDHQRCLLEALEARLLPAQAPPEPDRTSAEISRLSHLVEELKEGQQLQLAAAAASHEVEVPPAPTEQRRQCSERRLRAHAPPPLNSMHLAVAAMDAGPEPEPHSRPATPAVHCSFAAGDAATPAHFATPAPVPPALASLPEGNSLLAGPAPEPPRPEAHLAQGCAADSTPEQAFAPPSPLAVSSGMGLISGPGRVARVQQWVVQQGWAGIAFDKLVLHLDRLGVELSVGEQDALKWCLHGCSRNHAGHR